MAEARRELAWSQTAELLAMLFNGLFRPAQPLSASDFDPTQTHGAISEPVMEVPLTALKVFVPSQTR